MKNFEAFKELGDLIWNIANLLRGLYRLPKYRGMMISLTDDVINGRGADASPIEQV
jgi:hypothetical protein